MTNIYGTAKRFMILQFIEACLLLAVGFELTACITTAAARNDFSRMGNDAVSTLIKGSGSEKRGPHGFVGIDKEKVKLHARDLFMNKKEPDVLQFFIQNGDRCVTSSLQAGEVLLKCEASRWWKLKKIEFLLPESEDPLWPIPGAELIFKFYIMPTKEIVELEIEIVDITIQKKIYR